MSCPKLLEELEPHVHLVQLYGEDDHLLARNVGQYLSNGLSRGDGLFVIASEEHRDAFFAELAVRGADPVAAIERGWLVMLDVRETLDRFMVDGWPDRERFERVLGGMLKALASHVRGAGIRAYGEMVGVLWQEGQRDAAIRLEEYWNDLLGAHTFSLYCAYPIDVFGRDFQMSSVDGVLCTHTHLLPAGDELEGAIERAMAELLGPRVDALKPLIRANFRPAWAALPRGEALVLWLRNNLPHESDRILARARQHLRTASPVSRIAQP